MAAAEVTVGLHVSDHGLDGAAASQFALDDAEDAARLAGDAYATWIGRAVTPISLVDIGTLDLAAGKPFGVFDHDAQRVAIIGVARHRFGVQHELAAWRAGIGGGDRGLDAELVGCAGLALSDALDLGSVEGIQLPAALALALRTDLVGARERPFKQRASRSAFPAILRRMSRMIRPSRMRRRRNWR